MRATELEAVVMGRVCVDLYPMQLRVPLERVEGFHKCVGGFAGNVATGLARLGVRTAIVSAVGDDGHGRYVRDWLTTQGVDCRWLGTHPTLRTALAFCEAWPPDNFPITFYRTPTCPDWELTVSSLDLESLAAVPLAYAGGTGFTVLDLDWRAVLWDDPADYAACMPDAARHAGVALGSDEELIAAVG